MGGVNDIYDDAERFMREGMCPHCIAVVQAFYECGIDILHRLEGKCPETVGQLIAQLGKEDL